MQEKGECEGMRLVFDFWEWVGMRGELDAGRRGIVRV